MPRCSHALRRHPLRHGWRSPTFLAVPVAAALPIEMVDGQPLTMHAVGMGLDGSDLIFFGRWSDSGGIPIATRAPRDRVVSVTTDGSTHGLRAPRRDAS